MIIFENGNDFLSFSYIKGSLFMLKYRYTTARYFSAFILLCRETVKLHVFFFTQIETLNTKQLQALIPTLVNPTGKKNDFLFIYDVLLFWPHAVMQVRGDFGKKRISRHGGHR